MQPDSSKSRDITLVFVLIAVAFILGTTFALFKGPGRN
jgi:hypothetical protein